MAPAAEMHFAKLCVRGAAGSCYGCGSIRAAGAAGAVAPGEGAEVPGRSVARRTGPAPGQLLKIRQATPAATATPISGHIRLDDFVGRSERSHAAIASWGRSIQGSRECLSSMLRSVRQWPAADRRSAPARIPAAGSWKVRRGAMNPSGNVLQQFGLTLELFSSGLLACALPRRSNHGERACFQPVSGMGSAHGAG
jgi:hypothetical protein